LGHQGRHDKRKIRIEYSIASPAVEAKFSRIAALQGNAGRACEDRRRTL